MDFTELEIEQWLAILGAFCFAAMAVIEFADRLGLPTPLLERRQRRTKSLIVDTLKEVGLLPYRDRISALASGLSGRILPGDYNEDDLKPLIRRYRRDETIQVGTAERKDIRSPIDFLSAASEKDDIEQLARCLACFILRTTNDNPKIAYSAIATPINGNVVLAHLTANLLDRQLILLNTENMVIENSPVFGTSRHPENVILLHDVVYTGRRICRAVDFLRQSDMTVNAVFCLIERTDGAAPEQRAKEMLARREVPSFSLLAFDADELENTICAEGEMR